MKRLLRTILFSGVICLLFTDCRKETSITPFCTPLKWFPLEVGNYWVYKNYSIYDDGRVFDRKTDSMYISSDTLMLGFRFFHLEGDFSVHPIDKYLTSDNGQIRSASGYVFYECPQLFPSKKLYPLISFDFPGTIKTVLVDSLLRVPAGDYKSFMLFEAHSMLEDTIWIVTYKCYYAKNVGMVKFTARCVDCDFENVSELIRYKIEN
jgi:hypothetical protein